MAEPGRSGRGGLAATWGRLNLEQRVAAVAALLLVVSTFGALSFVEAAIVLTAGGVLALLKKRADGKPFHLPFGDGAVILAAGVWSAFLIVVRLFDRPLGQSVLALACAAILAGAGARERAKRPADDLPGSPEARPPQPRPSPETQAPATQPLGTEDAPTQRSAAGNPPPGPRR